MRKITFLFSVLVICSAYSYAQTSTVTDKDGNVYPVAKIGNRYWTTQNLRVTHFNNGDAIPNGTTVGNYSGEESPIYFFTPDAATKKNDGYAWTLEKTGLYYTWFAVNDARGIAPEGWRVATDADWKDLEKAIGMSADQIAIEDGWRGADTNMDLKLKATEGWKSDGLGVGTDDYGFKAFPVGYWKEDGADRSDLYSSEWWVSKAGLEDGKYMERKIHQTVAGIFKDPGDRNPKRGFNVRLVKDVATSVNSVQNEFQLLINVNNDRITVEGNSDSVNSVVTIYDVMGKKIISQTVNGVFKFDLNIERQSVYFANLTNGLNNKTVKFVIQ